MIEQILLCNLFTAGTTQSKEQWIKIQHEFSESINIHTPKIHVRFGIHSFDLRIDRKKSEATNSLIKKNRIACEL